MPKTKSKPNYEQLKSELDAILLELQSEELDIDMALERYKRSLELIEQIEKYLKTAENNIRELKAKFDSR